ncbi:MAG: dihydrofolate synthase [Actinobacteria bacterium]|nr:dihydrofolate synthase [Actinomycetota bacterium]
MSARVGESDPTRVADALAYLQRLVDHEISSVGISAGQVDGLNLDAPAAVLDVLGRPDRALRIVHITGTNGKGSVARMVEALVTASGLRAGTYLSPEGTVNERIRIDGAPLDDESLADAIISVRNAAEASGQTLTAFEAVTLTALVAFADAPVDVAVIEVGLLGRYDATNIVDGDVAVITSIDGDHTDFAERWLERVAEEKAGIIKAGSTVVLGHVADELMPIIEAEPSDKIVRIDRDFEVLDDRIAVGGRQLELVTSRRSQITVHVPLHGAHQSANAAVAIEATESVLHVNLSDDTVAAAFESLVIPGRIEVARVEPLVVLDGGHNPDAARSLGETLSESFMVAGRRVAVIGMLAGRSPKRYLEALNAEFPLDLVVACAVGGDRGSDGTWIAEAADELSMAVVAAPSIDAGLRRALREGDESDLIVVAGSFRVLEPARATLRSVAAAQHD